MDPKETTLNIRRFIGAALAIALAPLSTASLAEYPERELLGVIMWGAGGATDTVARGVGPHAEAVLGQKIVMLNKSGGAGAISTAYVNAAPADGYTVLFGAENPQLHKVLGVSQIDYNEMTPINVLARGIVVIVANNDQPWTTFKELVEDAQSRPGEIKMGSTGPGGLPHVVGSLLSAVTDFEVTSVPFDGEGPGITALQGGHVDFMPTGLSAAAEHIKAGRVRVLAVVDTSEVDALPGVPPVTADYPGFAKYLPWGPFYGVFVRKDVPDAEKAVLADAFHKAAENPQFVEMMVGRGNIMMNISGDEADAFLKQWQSITTWILHDVGETKASPADFGIPQP